MGSALLDTLLVQVDTVNCSFAAKRMLAIRICWSSVVLIRLQ